MSPAHAGQSSRDEYARAVHDLLDLDVDGNALLPDTIPHRRCRRRRSFSPAVGRVSESRGRGRGTALGEPNAPTSSVTYAVSSAAACAPSTAPVGTRGGVSVSTLPADGQYTSPAAKATPNGALIGGSAPDEQVDLDRRRARRVARGRSEDVGPNRPQDAEDFVKAGPQRVSARSSSTFRRARRPADRKHGRRGRDAATAPVAAPPALERHGSVRCDRRLRYAESALSPLPPVKSGAGAVRALDSRRARGAATGVRSRMKRSTRS